METGKILVLAFDILIATSYVYCIAKAYRKQATFLFAAMSYNIATKGNAIVKLFINF